MCDTGLATGEWRLSIISSPSIYLDCCTNAHDGGGVQQSPMPLSLQLVSHSSNLTMDISLGPIHNLRRGSFYDEAMLFGSQHLQGKYGNFIKMSLDQNVSVEMKMSDKILTTAFARGLNSYLTETKIKLCRFPKSFKKYFKVEPVLQKICDLL